MTFLPWRSVPHPVDWAAQSPSMERLVLEVGFGDGRYLASRAQAERASLLIGVDVSKGSLVRALRRVRRLGVSNARLARVSGHLALKQLFAPKSVDEIIVNFPCPWPKERHSHHRVLNRDFFALAANRLASRGEIALATDDDDYLAFALAEAEASRLFTARLEEPPSLVLETKYAQKWREQGRGVHYVIFARNRAAAPHAPPWERPRIMPHALLTGTLKPPAAFEKQVAAFGDAHVILHELAASLGGESESARLLLRVTVDEPGIRQQLLVVVQQRSADEVIVRLDTFGEPLMTRAVRGAVHVAAEWLLSNSPLLLKERNY